LAADILGRMFAPVSGGPVAGAATLAIMTTLGLAVAMYGKNTFQLSHSWSRPAAFGLAASFAAALAMIYAAGNSPFLYFQF
jgi:hypothetical protein